MFLPQIKSLHNLTFGNAARGRRKSVSTTMKMIVLVATVLSAAVLGAPAADLVTELPGWQGALPSATYSGYVNVSDTAGMPMMVHYLYIESEGSPAADPTILWTNGGPGASSMFGIFVELGPLLLNEDSLTTDDYKKTGVPTLYRNPYAWSKLGGVLMFDWPPPVGFSYCNGDPTGGGKSCGPWDDERMATVQHAAVVGWFAKFPERRTNDLYLTGESYAGIYVPKLAQQILHHRDPSVYPQLRGFAVGDGCLGSESGICGGDQVWWSVLFLYGHGQISNALWEAILATCGMPYLKQGGDAPPGCAAQLARVASEAGGYFAYGLYARGAGAHSSSTHAVLAPLPVPWHPHCTSFLLLTCSVPPPAHCFLHTTHGCFLRRTPTHACADMMTASTRRGCGGDDANLVWQLTGT